MALVLNVIGGKVSFFAAAREVKRENDGGEDEGDGEKIALNAFTGFSPPPPSRDIARCGRKGHTHSRPLSRAALAWLLTTTPNGELARGLPVTVNSYGKKQNKVFNFQWILAGSLFSATPLPQDETKNPFRVTWKRLEKVIPTWNAYMCKKQQDLQLSTNFAIVVSTRGRELFRLLTIVAWSLIQVESTLFTLMRNSVLGQEIYLVRIISISIWSHSVGFLSEQTRGKEANF